MLYSWSNYFFFKKEILAIDYLTQILLNKSIQRKYSLFVIKFQFGFLWAEIARKHHNQS